MVYNEQQQLSKRHIEFSVLALRDIAGQAVGSRCLQVTKLSECLYNKVFSLKVENGKEIIARIKNPNAGDSQSIVVSEVMTLIFTRGNHVGAEYMLMERVKGRQLSESWDTMSEAQLFGLVKSGVGIEQKLINAKVTSYGSLYTKTRSLHSTSNFVVGTTTQRSFWEDHKRYLDLDGGHGTTSLLRRTPKQQDEHIQLLEKFLTVLPHIIPSAHTLRPVLLHYDLHPKNIFVDDSDPTQITVILQAMFPSISRTDGPYLWGAVQPKLPEGFDTFTPAAQIEEVLRARIKKIQRASHQIHGFMRNDNDPTAFIFHIVGETSSDGPFALKELLQTYKKDITASRRQAEAWAEAFNAYETLRADFSGHDGWVSHEEGEDALRRWDENKDTLETLRKRLEKLL
ncbi:hypothetical protein BDV12DRAFT_206848 [Aspergillus spectabilis]